MRIAVSYELETGNVFDHFGHAEAFKIYDVENDEIISTELVRPQGMGHTVMVNLMVQKNVDVVVCGFIGGHALDGLKENGIKAYSDAEGNADEAVKAYLRGELQEAPEGMSCHHEEGHSCCGGCHSEPQVLYEGKNAGKKVQVHYCGTLNDGTQFDSSYDRGEPLAFVCAIGQVVPGFDKAVLDMEVGEVKNIHLMPEEAYGPSDPNNIATFEISSLPGSENLEVGQSLYLSNQFGQPIPVHVIAKDETTITFDANHIMAGKELNFKLELVSVE